MKFDPVLVIWPPCKYDQFFGPIGDHLNGVLLLLLLTKIFQRFQKFFIKYLVLLAQPFLLFTSVDMLKYLDVEVVMRFSGMRKPARLSKSFIICPLMLRSS